MENLTIIGISVALALYLIYRIFFRTNKGDIEYKKLYEKVLNSPEYKPKGQYER